MDLREVTEFCRDFMGYIIAVAVLLFVMLFIIAVQPIAGNSMNPTLKDGQFTLVLKCSYLFSPVERGDIVALTNHDKSYVKRVIGLPGEKIEYMDGKLLINDETYLEKYLGDKVVTTNFTFSDICSKKDCPDGKIPEGKYMVMGDNRPESKDSRDKEEFGLVDKKDIKGKIFFSLNPFGGV
jgi:signal peptidase I